MDEQLWLNLSTEVHGFPVELFSEMHEKLECRVLPVERTV